MKFGFDWPGGLEKMFENGGEIHVYSPGSRDRQTPGVNFISLTQLFSQVLCCKFSPLNDFVTVFTIQTCRQPN